MTIKEWQETSENKPKIHDNETEGGVTLRRNKKKQPRLMWPTTSTGRPKGQSRCQGILGRQRRAGNRATPLRNLGGGVAMSVVTVVTTN